MGVVIPPWERWWHGKTHTIAAYEIHGFCYTPMGKVMAWQNSYRMVFAMMHGFCHEAWLIPCITLFHPKQAVRRQSKMLSARWRVVCLLGWKLWKGRGSSEMPTPMSPQFLWFLHWRVSILVLGWSDKPTWPRSREGGKLPCRGISGRHKGDTGRKRTSCQGPP